jgi:hypothetical protein
MKNKYFIFIILLFTTGLVLAENLGPLPDVLKPEMIRVSGDQLFIVQGPEIFNFSLKDMKLLRTFGRKGEGPGELKVSSIWYNSLAVRPDFLFVDSMDKFIYFSRNGELIKETRKPPEAQQAIPVGKNFLGINQVHIEDKVQYQVLYLFDSSFKKIKELFKQKATAQSVTRTTELIADVMDFQVWENKIFIERSREGFIIDVFDGSGKKLYRIQKEIEKIPVTGKHREAAENKFKQDPFIREIGFENFKRNMGEFIYPDYFPPIQNLDVSGGKIYARTFKTEKGKEECIVMDLKGNILGRKYLPVVDRAPFVAYMVGIRYYTIHNNKYYYLKENEEAEVWELHVEKL